MGSWNVSHENWQVALRSRGTEKDDERETDRRTDSRTVRMTECV